MIYLFPNSPRLIEQYPVATPDIAGYLLSQTATRTTQSEMLSGRVWGVDCQMYAAWAYGKPFKMEQYKASLWRMVDHPGRCAFIIVPDVLTKAKETIEQYKRLESDFRVYGLPLAFAAQNGLSRIPDDLEYDCLFVGGDDAYRRTKDCRAVIRQAKEAEKWIHVGRINTPKNIEWAHKLGADSCDGTKTAIEPNQIIKICSKIRALSSQKFLL